MDFDTLHIQFERFFRVMESPPYPLRLYNNVYFMAFDAEWYQSGDKNTVLSYQIATVSRNSSQNIIEFVPPGKRLKLAEIVEFGVRSVNQGCIPDNHATTRNLAVLISHSTVAEWSVLADRDASYITKQLTAIRKSPVTSQKPIEIILGDYACPCHVQLYDTRLIAPADFQSLKKLSTMLGSDDELKVEIGHHHIKRMDRLIKIDYPLYEKYALQDSEITLKLFFLLQSTLMELAGYNLKLYRTLASGAVKGFLRRAPCFDFYQMVLKNGCFEGSFKFIRSAYHGGRNEGFFVGRSDKYPEVSNRLWVDIDFVGCYPTAMALCPTIDCGIDPFACRPRGRNLDALLQWIANPVTGEIKYLPRKYHLPILSDDAMRAAGVDKVTYEKARNILEKVTPDIDPRYHAQLMSEFDACLGGIKHKSERDRLREMAQVIDNSLIDSWYVRWNSKPDNADQAVERYIIPGFAKIRFAFKDETLYPCLPVSHPSYGLLYPLRGETFATAPEIMLALDAGCKIEVMESVELPVVMEEGGLIPRRLFFEHLADLTRKRNEQKKIIKGADSDERQKAVVLERFIKEFMNSFYGKTAQAINYKKMYDPKTGLMKALGPSQISEACTAALATGLPRSALSAVLLAIDQYNRDKPLSDQIIVASCTTDGLLVGLPRPEGVTAADYYEVKYKTLKEPVVAGVGGGETDVPYHELKKGIADVNTILTSCGCGDLVPLIESYMPIRQMRNARRELTTDENGNFDDTFLEIKHFADQVAGVKTRGQIGWMEINNEKVVTIQAKFGLKPPVTDIIRMKDELKCQDILDGKMSMKQLDDEYDRVMNVGGSVKATLECNWILDQIDRINNGEVDVFEYTFYGLKNFNEIIKGGSDLDLTQTKAGRKFNADFDWKRKLVMIDGVLSPFSVPHLDKKEMRSYRGQVEKTHRWRKLSIPETVIQLRQLAHSKTSNRGGPAAKLVRLFLAGMLFDHIPGGVKIGSGGKKDRVYESVATTVTNIWNSLGFKFEAMTPNKRGKVISAVTTSATSRSVVEGWTEDNVKYVAREDKWVANDIPLTARLEELLAALCQQFQIEYEIARKMIFATKIMDEPDIALVLQVALAILKGPALGIEPFTSLYNSNKLPIRSEILREFHPHLTESLLASYEHLSFQKGGCDGRDSNRLKQYFLRLGLNRLNAEACVQVMLPEKEGRTTLARNPGKERCVRVFAQALRNTVHPPVAPSVIIQKLRRYGLNLSQFFGRVDSKFERHSIKDTAENRALIKKLARLFSLDAEIFMREMIDS